MTETAKHTPGPWRAGFDPHPFPKDGERRLEICLLPHPDFDAVEVYGPGERRSAPDWNEFKANAALIAAAPDMLAALKALSASIFAPNDQRSPELRAAVEMAIAAISRATPAADRKE